MIPGAAAARPAPAPARHPGPQPYHRVLRTRDYRWWRPLVGLLVFGVTFLTLAMGAFVVGFLVQLAVTGGAAGPEHEALPEDGTPTALLVTNLFLAAGIPAALLAVRVAHGLGPGWLGSVRPGLRWGLLGRLLALATLLTAGYLVVVALLPVEAPAEEDLALAGLGPWLGLALVVVLTTPLQAAGEEYALRGYLLQVCGAWVRTPWFAVVVTSVLFAVAHGLQGPALFTDRLVFGLVAGWLVIRTGGLEAAIAAHVAINMVTLLVSAAFDTVGDTLSLTDIPWPYALVSMAQVALFAVLADRVVRRRRVATRTSS